MRVQSTPKRIMRKIAEEVLAAAGGLTPSVLPYPAFATRNDLPETAELDTIAFIQDEDVFVVYNVSGWEDTGIKWTEISSTFATKEEVELGLSKKASINHSHPEFIQEAVANERFALKSDLKDYDDSEIRSELGELDTRIEVLEGTEHFSQEKADELYVKEGSVYTKEQSDEQLRTKADINHIHSDYAMKEHVHSQYIEETTANERFALKSDIKEFDDTALRNDITELDTRVTEIESTDLFTEAEANELYASKTSVYTKEQVDESLNTKADANHVHTEYSPVNHEHTEYITEEVANERFALKDEACKCDDTEVKNAIAELDERVDALETEDRFTQEEAEGLFAQKSHKHDEYLEEADALELFALKTDIEAPYDDSELRNSVSGLNTRVEVLEAENRFTEADADAIFLRKENAITEEFVNQVVSTKADAEHTHDEFITEVEADGKYALKSEVENYDDSELKGQVSSLTERLNTLETEDRFTEEEANELFLKKDEGVTPSQLQAGLSEKADSSHTHDEYITKVAADDKFALKSELTTYDDTELRGQLGSLQDELDVLKTEDRFTEAEADVKFLTKSEGATKTELSEGLSSKADADHGHSEYALATHKHSEYALAEHEHNQYSRIDHVHTEYMTSEDADAKFALKVDVNPYDDTAIKAQLSELDNRLDVVETEDRFTETEATALFLKKGEGVTESQLQEGLNEKAAKNHGHTEYALTGHTHPEYASSTHEHLEYIKEDDANAKFALKTDLDGLGPSYDDSELRSEVSGLNNRVEAIESEERFTQESADALYMSKGEAYTKAEVDVKFDEIQQGNSADLDVLKQHFETRIPVYDTLSDLPLTTTKPDTLYGKVDGDIYVGRVTTKRSHPAHVKNETDGFTIKTNYTGTGEFFKMIDNDSSSYFSMYDSRYTYVQYDFPAPRVINGFGQVGPITASGGESRLVEQLDIQGVDAEGNTHPITTLDFTGLETGEYKSVCFENSTAYPSYRITNFVKATANYIFCDIEFLEYRIEWELLNKPETANIKKVVALPDVENYSYGDMLIHEKKLYTLAKAETLVGMLEGNALSSSATETTSKKAFDDNTTTYYESVRFGLQHNWLGLVFAEPKEVGGLSFTTTQGEIVSWAVQTTLDGEVWETEMMSDETLPVGDLKLDIEPKTVLGIRLVAFNVAGTSAYRVLRISEMKIIETTKEWELIADCESTLVLAGHKEETETCDMYVFAEHSISTLTENEYITHSSVVVPNDGLYVIDFRTTVESEEDSQVELSILLDDRKQQVAAGIAKGIYTAGGSLTERLKEGTVLQVAMKSEKAVNLINDTEKTWMKLTRLS